MSDPTYRIPARIETERLVIRRYVTADAEQLARLVLANVAHLERYMEWIAVEPQTVEQRRAWIADVNAKFDAGEDFTLGMFDLEGTLVGGTGFHVRTDPARLAIGYWIARDREGQGLVTEATAALTWVGLRLAGASIVDVSHAPSNTRSARVPERLGYERQPGALEQCFDDGAKEPSVSWWATAATLEREPLASAPHPRAFDSDGNAMRWPT